MDSSVTFLLLVQQNEVLMVQQEAFREIIQQLTQENRTLREQNAALTVQNSTYLEFLERNQDTESQTSNFKESKVVVKDMQRTIESLQERVIGLVQEKLSMQIFIEELEHALAMTLPHATPRKTFSKKKLPIDMEKISPELALDDTSCTTSSQHECLETARRLQQAQLLLDDDWMVSGQQQVIDDENCNPLLGEFNIRKELEEQFDRRTIVVRPSDEFVRSRSNQRVATSKYLPGGKIESLAGPIQEAKEENEKQRSRLWISRIGFKGSQEALSTVVKPAQQRLGNHQTISDPVRMMECKDGIQSELNVSDGNGNRGKDTSARKKKISTNVNLLL